MTAIDRVAATSFGDYSPALVVDAVNALWPLGAEAALEQILTAGAAVPPPPTATGLFWVLRSLFDVAAPPGHPPVLLGAPDVPPPSRPGALPRFPIVIVRDVPFLVVRGYALAGLPEEVDSHVDYYRRYGALRSEPLAPDRDARLDEEFDDEWSAAYVGEQAPHVSDLIPEQIERLRASGQS